MYKVANKMIVAEFTRFEENHGAVVRILEKIPIWARHLYFKMVLGILSLHGDKSKYVLSSSRHNLIIKKDLIVGEPKELEFVLVELAIQRFNRIGSEGISSESVDGKSVSYEDDFESYKIYLMNSLSLFPLTPLKKVYNS